ncbi:MAG TPA: hypothetical protein VML55_23060 [Planctomycetaceae bacterium]|nr:hypothetical protein [Planctomycetaceae bacterium]
MSKGSTLTLRVRSRPVKLLRRMSPDLEPGLPPFAGFGYKSPWDTGTKPA